MTGPTATRVNRAVCRALGPLTTRANDKVEASSRE